MVNDPRNAGDAEKNLVAAIIALIVVASIIGGACALRTLLQPTPEVFGDRGSPVSP